MTETPAAVTHRPRSGGTPFAPGGDPWSLPRGKGDPTGDARGSQPRPERGTEYQPRQERGTEYQMARLVLLLCIPLLLLLSNLYMVATPAFIRYEYGKPDFSPADFYGAAERLTLAEATLHYLRSSAGPDYLWKLSSQGQEVYNPREVKHLVDVKVVMRAAFWVQGICAMLCIAATLFLWRRPQGRYAVLHAVYQGGLALFILLAAIGVLAYTSFDVFFVFFHRIFFRGDSWLFAYSDTLIQLFPVQFWMDATAALAVLAVVESVLVSIVAYTLSRRVHAAPQWRDAVRPGGRRPNGGVPAPSSERVR